MRVLPPLPATAQTTQPTSAIPPVGRVVAAQVVTPVAIADGMPWILVNRGWAARSMADRARLPSAPIASGPLRVEGAVEARLGDPAVLRRAAGPGG